jgi:hypothetical protein
MAAAPLPAAPEVLHVALDMMLSIQDAIYSGCYLYRVDLYRVLTIQGNVNVDQFRLTLMRLGHPLDDAQNQKPFFGGDFTNRQKQKKA